MYELRKKCLDEYLSANDAAILEGASKNVHSNGEKRRRSQLSSPLLTSPNIDSFLQMLPPKRKKNSVNGSVVSGAHDARGAHGATTPERRPFCLHTALRCPVPRQVSALSTITRDQSIIKSVNKTAENLQSWRAAEEYYYLLHKSNPGDLLLQTDGHPRRVVSFSQTGPLLPKDTLYLVDHFISPGASLGHNDNKLTKVGTSGEGGKKGNFIQMVWDDNCTRMVELPRRSPLVLVKICTGTAYDSGGNMVSRFEMRAVKKLARWENGSLVWPLKVVGDKTLVELQRI